MSERWELTRELDSADFGIHGPMDDGRDHVYPMIRTPYLPCAEKMLDILKERDALLAQVAGLTAQTTESDESMAIIVRTTVAAVEERDALREENARLAREHTQVHAWNNTLVGEHYALRADLKYARENWTLLDRANSDLRAQVARLANTVLEHARTWYVPEPTQKAARGALADITKERDG